MRTETKESAKSFEQLLESMTIDEQSELASLLYKAEKLLMHVYGDDKHWHECMCQDECLRAIWVASIIASQRWHKSFVAQNK